MKMRLESSTPKWNHSSLGQLRYQQEPYTSQQGKLHHDQVIGDNLQKKALIQDKLWCTKLVL